MRVLTIESNICTPIGHVKPMVKTFKTVSDACQYAFSNWTIAKTEHGKYFARMGQETVQVEPIGWDAWEGKQTFAPV